MITVCVCSLALPSLHPPLHSPSLLQGLALPGAPAPFTDTEGPGYGGAVGLPSGSTRWVMWPSSGCASGWSLETQLGAGLGGAHGRGPRGHLWPGQEGALCCRAQDRSPPPLCRAPKPQPVLKVSWLSVGSPLQTQSSGEAPAQGRTWGLRSELAYRGGVCPSRERAWPHQGGVLGSAGPREGLV